LLSKLFADENRDEKGGIVISQEDLVTNAQSYIIAGTDTTALSLTYLIWEVCRNPKIRDTLISELRTLPEQGITDLHDEPLRRLRFLNHLVDETLRLHPAVGAGLPRVVPPGGTSFEGHFLPAGTVVTCQAYSLSRNPAIFPSPEVFDPLRWESETKDMRDSIMAFGSGSRGMSLYCAALMALRRALKSPTWKLEANSTDTE
jgi:cytochrome P450